MSTITANTAGTIARPTMALRWLQQAWEVTHSDYPKPNRIEIEWRDVPTASLT